MYCLYLSNITHVFLCLEYLKALIPVKYLLQGGRKLSEQDKACSEPYFHF